MNDDLQDATPEELLRESAKALGLMVGGVRAISSKEPLERRIPTQHQVAHILRARYVMNLVLDHLDEELDMPQGPQEAERPDAPGHGNAAG